MVTQTLAVDPESTVGKCYAMLRRLRSAVFHGCRFCCYIHMRVLGGGGDGGATGVESRDCYLNMYAEKKPGKVDPNELLKPPCLVDKMGNLFNVNSQNPNVINNMGSYVMKKRVCYNGVRESEFQVVRGTNLIPCPTEMRGGFPLNGTYFQFNEVFMDFHSRHNPIEVPRNLIWNLRMRISTIYNIVSGKDIFVHEDSTKKPMTKTLGTQIACCRNSIDEAEKQRERYQSTKDC